jgi:hypothetical protein
LGDQVVRGIRLGVLPTDASWQVVVEDRRKLFLGHDAVANQKGMFCIAPIIGASPLSRC